MGKWWLTTPIFVAAALASITACGGGADDGGSEPTATATATSAAAPAADDAASGDATTAFRERMTAIEAAVATWRAAETIEDARAAAEAAANLVVGPAGPGYGDRDGNGAIEGASDIALLPVLAAPLDANPCIVADVLGGSWDDPEARWNAMLAAIEDWRPDHNTMPSLLSHPMRIVGWATFTLASDSIDEAHEYAGHAQLHVNVSLAALDC
ncbi:MAG: hypothetical protein O3A10_00630 [Chloroflexi bacterium]|nr:hypothetical protein [Chloroflexota bacterium]